MRGYYETLIESDSPIDTAIAVHRLEEMRKRNLALCGTSPMLLQQMHDSWSKDIVRTVRHFGNRGDTFDRLKRLSDTFHGSLALEDILRIYIENRHALLMMRNTVVGLSYGYGVVMAYSPIN